MFYVLGLFIGFFLFGSTVTSFWDFWNNAGFAGTVTVPEWLGVSPEVVVFAVAVMALLMFAGAEKVERIMLRRRRGVERG